MLLSAAITSTYRQSQHSAIQLQNELNSLKQLQKSQAEDITQLKTTVEAQSSTVSVPIEKPVVTTLEPVKVVQTSPSDAKSFIYQKESGNNPGAINPSSGACGLGQALPCSKMPCSLQDYACQDTFFTSYMLSRYGSWDIAYNWWLSHKWW